MKQCGKPNCNDPDSCKWPNCNNSIKTKGKYEEFWDNFDMKKYQNYLFDRK